MVAGREIMCSWPADFYEIETIIVRTHDRLVKLPRNSLAISLSLNIFDGPPTPLLVVTCTQYRLWEEAGGSVKFSVGGYFYVGASPRSVHQRRDIVFIDKCYAAAACANHSQFHLTTREMRTWLDRLFVGGNKRDEREMDRRGRLFKETNDKIRHSDQVSARQRNRQCNCWQSDHELKERKTVK